MIFMSMLPGTILPDYAPNTAEVEENDCLRAKFEQSEIMGITESWGLMVEYALHARRTEGHRVQLNTFEGLSLLSDYYISSYLSGHVWGYPFLLFDISSCLTYGGLVANLETLK